MAMAALARPRSPISEPVPFAPKGPIGRVPEAIGAKGPNGAAPSLDFEERAAVIEEGAKVPRDWAEAFARLQAMPAPAGVDPADWTARINGAGRFLDQWGTQAAALGWTAEEVLRFDPTGLGAAQFLAEANVTEVGPKAIAFRIGPNVWRLCRRENFA
jgi:hypothetical protein